MLGNCGEADHDCLVGRENKQKMLDAIKRERWYFRNIKQSKSVASME